MATMLVSELGRYSAPIEKVKSGVVPPIVQTTLKIVGV